MSLSYRMKVAGLERDLPICKVTDDLYIGAFVIFGDVELTQACARELLRRAPEHDIMITAESKGIPLVYEMARQSGENRYLLARKAPKLYMKNVFKTTVKSITTAQEQILCMDQEDADFMKGRKVLIVDDVISTGESLRALGMRWGFVRIEQVLCGVIIEGLLIYGCLQYTGAKGFWKRFWPCFAALGCVVVIVGVEFGLDKAPSVPDAIWYCVMIAALVGFAALERFVTGRRLRQEKQA